MCMSQKMVSKPGPQRRPVCRCMQIPYRLARGLTNTAHGGSQRLRPVFHTYTPAAHPRQQRLENLLRDRIVFGNEHVQRPVHKAIPAQSERARIGRSEPAAAVDADPADVAVRALARIGTAGRDRVGRRDARCRETRRRAARRLARRSLWGQGSSANRDPGPARCHRTQTWRGARRPPRPSAGSPVCADATSPCSCFGLRYCLPIQL